MFTHHDDFNVEPICYDEKHINNVLNAIRVSFDAYFERYLETQAGTLISGAELKYENSINRINSAANPRNIERVPKGSKFDFEIIFAVYEEDDENIAYLLDAMRLLEDNYLGGSGSRGFGQIKFEEIKLTKRTSDYYKENRDEDLIIESNDITEVINALK